MATSKPQDPYRLASLRKGLEVIDCFTRRESWTLAELAAALDLSKPTIFRILHTLQEFGFLTKDPDSARYAPGLRFHALGSAALRREHLRWQALPPIQDLAESTGETVHVGILHGWEAVCVQAVEGTRLIRMHAFVGKRTPAHASALGKVLLAHLPASELDHLLADRELPRFTPNTLSDPHALRAELERIRAQGWGMDNEEIETGLRCLGVPITDHTGRVSACIALAAPAARMEPQDLRALLPRLRDTASRISVMLGSPIRQAA